MNCKAKPYLFQSESQNPETVVHEGKNSSLRIKGLGFLVAFHDKPYETMSSNQKKGFYSQKKTDKKRRTRNVSLFFRFNCDFDLDTKNNITADHSYTAKNS